MIERAPRKPSSKIQEEEAYLVRSAMAIVISNRSAMTGVVWGKELGADGGKELGAVMGRQWCATRGEEPARRGHAVKRRLLGEREIERGRGCERCRRKDGVASRSDKKGMAITLSLHFLCGKNHIWLVIFVVYIDTITKVCLAKPRNFP